MTQDVFRRRVFYIPGFDPFPPRRYRELYRTESQEQARISDYTIAQEPLRSADNFGWRVTSTIEGRDTVSDITVLTWSDLVKSSMDRGVVWTYLSLIKTAWIYISSGALRDVMKLRKGPVIAALYPVGFLIAQLGFAILRKYRVSMTEHGRPVPVAHLTVRAKDGIWLDFQSRD